MARVTTDSEPSRWIVSRPFDLAWVFGGAALGLAAVGLAINSPAWIVPLWWLWLLAFDGPHMMAAYTRTYLDRQAWKDRRPLLLGSLLSFAVGPACLLVSVATGSRDAFLLFLGVATVYGYYHVVRQHYGFLALYKTRAGDRSRSAFHVDKWCLYLGCWLPYGFFLVSHPRARALIGLVPDAAPPTALVAAIATAWIAAVALFAAVSLAEHKRGRMGPKLLYGTVAMLFHGLAYYGVARFEPIYAASAGPDQDFLLLSIMITVFHNVQYVALVYLHNRSRYSSAGGNAAGPSGWLIRSPFRFLFVCLSFSVIYFSLASSTAVFPSFQNFIGATVGPFRVNDLALATWWGLSLHHYFLDQRIWRIKSDPSLRQHLGLAA